MGVLWSGLLNGVVGISSFLGDVVCLLLHASMVVCAYVYMNCVHGVQLVVQLACAACSHLISKEQITCAGTRVHQLWMGAEWVKQRWPSRDRAGAVD